MIINKTVVSGGLADTLCICVNNGNDEDKIRILSNKRKKERKKDSKYL